MAGFPAPNSTDPDDVTTALETAAALWKRGDRGEALTWLKRAARAASEAELDDRALELARSAADLAESPPPAATSGDIDIDIDAPGSVDDEIDEIEEVEAIATPAPAKPAGPPKPPPRAAPPRPPPPARPASPSNPGGAPAAPAAGLPLSPDLTPAAPPAARPPSPSKPTSLPRPAAPAAPAAPVAPVAPAMTLAQALARPAPSAAAYSDENTVTEWPPPSGAFADSTTDVAWPVRQDIDSIEETVTEWPPRGAAHLLANFDPSAFTGPRPGTSPGPAPLRDPSAETTANAPPTSGPAVSAPVPTTPSGSEAPATGAATPVVIDAPVVTVAPVTAPEATAPAASESTGEPAASAPEPAAAPGSAAATSAPAARAPSPSAPAVSRPTPVSGRPAAVSRPSPATGKPAPAGPVSSGREASGPTSLGGKARSKPAQIDIDDDWFEASGPPTFRPQENPHKPAVPLADLMKRPGESIAPPPTEAEQAAAAVKAPSEPAPSVPAPTRVAPAAQAAPVEPPEQVAPEAIGAPPPTQKISVPAELLEASLPQSFGLDELPAFGDIPAEHRVFFFGAAKRKTLNAREFVRGFALGVVLRGEALVTGFNSEVVVARLKAGSVLRARGTAGKALPMRLSASAGGCDVVTWSEAPLNSSFQSCPWVDGELRAASNRTLGLVGAAAGLLGSLDGGVLEKLSEWLQPRVLGAGEVGLHEGEPTPPIMVVGTGSIELVRGTVVERTLGPGELVLPADCARGARAAVTARAGGEGAVVMAVDKARRQALEGAVPAVLALLAGL